MTRRLVAEFGAAGIEFSSPTLEIVKTPPLRIEGTAGKSGMSCSRMDPSNLFARFESF